MARNLTDESTGCLRDIHYVVHDRDTKFCASFESILTAAGVRPLKLPARSLNLNAFAEGWVRSAKQECLSKLILFGEGSLKRALTEFVDISTPNDLITAVSQVCYYPTKDNLAFVMAPMKRVIRG